MPAVFISHSSLDRKISDNVKTWLTQLGYERVFLDFDKHSGIWPGEDWEKRLHGELARCHVVILVLTPNWLKSHWCFAELVHARALGKLIIPIICEPLGDNAVLGNVQNLDLIDWKQDGLARLKQKLEAVAHDLARGFTLDPARLPFPGIHAFDIKDAAIYFGRDEETRAVIERLQARKAQGGARAQVITGASGSGKSSLLKAGVIPQLQRAREQWLVLPVVRPEKTPVEALAKAIAQQIGEPAAWRRWQDTLKGAFAVQHVAELFKDLRVGEARNATVLLPVDQLEEAFAASEAERKPFIRLLAGLLDPARGMPVMVLATGLSDVLDKLSEDATLAGVIESYALPPMPLDRVPRLVEGPAGVAGLNVDHGLPERMTRDIETSEALPLLAHTLWQLYRDGSAEKRLALTRYEALGDAARGLNPIQNSISVAAEEAIKQVGGTPGQMVALRDAFAAHLVRVRLEDGKRLRQRVQLSDLPSEARPLIDALTKARLLSIHEGRIECAHEALFRAWPLLDRWLSEEQDFLSDLERIKIAREIWMRARETEKTRALLSGLLLSRARGWLATFPRRFCGDDMKPLGAFIAESAAAEDAARSKARRLRQGALVVAVAAAGIFAVLAVLAQQQRQVADEQRAVARTAQARAQATFALGSDALQDNLYDLTEAAQSNATIGGEGLARMLDRTRRAFRDLEQTDASVVVVSFRNVKVGTRPIEAEPYLRTCGITVTAREPKESKIILAPNSAIYESQALQPTDSNTFLMQDQTGNVPASYTLRFDQPVLSVSFTRPALLTATPSGIVFPFWAAAALNERGQTIMSVSEQQQGQLLRLFNPKDQGIEERTFTLRSPGAFIPISSVRFDSDPRLNGRPFAAFSALVIARLAYVPVDATHPECRP